MKYRIPYLTRTGGLVLAVGAIFSLLGCNSAPIPAPTSYADFNSKVGTFACKYPEGWEVEGGGNHGLEWAKFKMGPAEIRVDAGLAGSLMGDIAKNLGGKVPDSPQPEDEPVHAVHAAGLKAAQKAFSGYNEVGQVEPFEAALGPARRSEFTAASSFGSNLHGYRATLLAHDKAVSVSCICPESDWKTLQPAFDEVLSSMKRGQEE